MRLQKEMEQNREQDINFLNRSLPTKAWETRKDGMQVLVRTSNHRKIRGVEPKQLHGQILH